MRKIIISLLLAIPSLVHASPLNRSETEDLVKRIEALHLAKPSLQANFREERHMAMLKDPVVNEGKVWCTLPDKIRREIGGNTPSTTVIDGKKMVIYYPNFKEEELYDLERRPVLRDSLQALTAGLDFQQVYNFYNIEAAKEGNVYQIVLTPKTSALRKVVRSVVLTVDPNLAPARVDFESARGEKVSITYSNVRREAIPESMFQFTTPPGTNVTKPLGG
ncbi:MAG: outer membrane lipoprotein carrier protein LolA [Chthoniobacterales bacterium]